MKIKQKENKDTFPFPEESVKAIKNKIKEYKIYEDFCVDHFAMKQENNKYSVVTFPVKQINDYYNQVIKPLLVKEGVTETFFFDTITKIYFTDETGTKNYTGYFCPKSFFDYIKNYFLMGEKHLEHGENERVKERIRLLAGIK